MSGFPNNKQLPSKAQANRALNSMFRAPAQAGGAPPSASNNNNAGPMQPVLVTDHEAARIAFERDSAYNAGVPGFDRDRSPARQYSAGGSGGGWGYPPQQDAGRGYQRAQHPQQQQSQLPPYYPPQQQAVVPFQPHQAAVAPFHGSSSTVLTPFNGGNETVTMAVLHNMLQGFAGQVSQHIETREVAVMNHIEAREGVVMNHISTEFGHTHARLYANEQVHEKDMSVFRSDLKKVDGKVLETSARVDETRKGVVKNAADIEKARAEADAQFAKVLEEGQTNAKRIDTTREATKRMQAELEAAKKETAAAKKEAAAAHALAAKNSKEMQAVKDDTKQILALLRGNQGAPAPPQPEDDGEDGAAAPVAPPPAGRGRGRGRGRGK